MIWGCLMSMSRPYKVWQTAHIEGRYVRRQPEATSNDFEKGDFTDDLDWNEVDFTTVRQSVVNAKAGLIRLLIMHGSSNKYVNLRRPGSVETKMGAVLRTQVANLYNDGNLIIPFKDGKVEMKCSPKPSDWTVLSMTLLGWFD